MTLPYALGCPTCPHYVEVSTEDPDTSGAELYGHVLNQHADWDRTAALDLLAKTQELTQNEAANR